jgi:hypothetical protein
MDDFTERSRTHLTPFEVDKVYNMDRNLAKEDTIVLLILLRMNICTDRR